MNQNARRKRKCTSTWGILKANTIKQATMKDKQNTSGEQGNYWKPIYMAEIASKG